MSVVYADEWLCKRCAKPKREHRLGYSALGCQFLPVPPVDSAALEAERDELVREIEHYRRGLLWLMSELKRDRPNPMAPVRMPWDRIAYEAADEIKRLRAAVSAVSVPSATEVTP